MSTFSNYFGKSDKGAQLYDVIGKMTEQERIDFLAHAETQKPGISEEYNVKTSMSTLGPEAYIKGHGTARGFTSEGLAGLSADIDAAEQNLIELEKGDIDEHLLTIEQMSGIELTNDYDSAFTYLKDAQSGFNNYIAEQKKSGASNKHIKQLEIKVKRGGKILNEDENAIIKDFKKMQTDIIKIRQDCINIDAKYRNKDEWSTSRIEQLVNIVQQHMSVQDVLDSFEDRKITMDEASEMESDDV